MRMVIHEMPAITFSDDTSLTKHVRRVGLHLYKWWDDASLWHMGAMRIVDRIHRMMMDADNTLYDIVKHRYRNFLDNSNVWRRVLAVQYDACDTVAACASAVPNEYDVTYVACGKKLAPCRRCIAQHQQSYAHSDLNIHQYPYHC